MELSELGFDGWFRKQWDEQKKPELNPARVVRVDRDRYIITNGQNEMSAEATGNLLFSSDSNESLPCVGDWVLVQYYNEGALAIIHEVLPRKSYLHRKAAGKKVEYQMIASNIDIAFIMQSCDENFNIRRLERYLVMVKEGGITPVVLFSKSGLIGEEERKLKLEELEKAHINERVLAFSNATGEGLEPIRDMLERTKTYCLLGSSGVGKTTLLNRLSGSDEFATAPVREKDSRGRHTTVSRQLIALESGALIIDTPGMRELGVMGAGASIEESFSEISALADGCKFRDCTHTKEKGCAVLQAVETGELDGERYSNYLKLKKESAFYQMSYVERRKKDKQFGKMVNTALKEVRKRKPFA